MLNGYSHIFFGETSVQIFWPFKKLGYLYSYWWVVRVFLYILESSPLSDICMVYGFRLGLRFRIFFFFACRYPIVPALFFLWDLSFTHWITLVSLLKISLPHIPRSTYELYSVPLSSVTILMAGPHYLN